MRKLSILIVIPFILTLFILGGCTPDESDRIFDELLQQRTDSIDENVDSSMEQTTDPDADTDSASETVPMSDLSGTLTVLTGWGDSHTATLANRFMEHHHGVEIVFEEYDGMDDPQWRMNLAEQTALITRLLANPPDIMNIGPFAFEKANFGQLFLDLNIFIDGPNGVNREDYFDNILRAAQINNNLYGVPLLLGSSDTVMLNKRYFEAIGVSIDEMRTITLSEFLDYHLRADELFPEDRIGIDSRFHMFDVFRFEPVHDVHTGVVNADTPEMREILEYIISVRLGGSVSYMPETVMGFISGTHFGTGQVDSSFTTTRINYMYQSVMQPEWVFFMQEHPLMSFSHPVHRMTWSGDIMFRNSLSLAIMSGSDNHDLAWEFVRFCMEYSDSMFQPELWMGHRTYLAYSGYPVNRHLFDNQFGMVLDYSFSRLVEQGFVDEADRDAQVEYAMSRFIALIEMINAQCRFDRHAMNSIIYPDIFQFHLGNQDVYTTLRNIQSRLEIYVAE